MTVDCGYRVSFSERINESSVKDSHIFKSKHCLCFKQSRPDEYTYIKLSRDSHFYITRHSFGCREIFSETLSVIAIEACLL